MNVSEQKSANIKSATSVCRRNFCENEDLKRSSRKFVELQVTNYLSASSLRHLWYEKKKQSKYFSLFALFWGRKKGLSSSFCGLDKENIFRSIVICLMFSLTTISKDHKSPLFRTTTPQQNIRNFSTLCGKSEEKQKLHKLFHRIIIHLRHNESLVQYKRENINLFAFSLT